MKTRPPAIQSVAVGIIRDSSGRVLINQRQPGKPFAGRWEFPGGKLDPGETVAQALVRELDEELGITVRCQRPLIRFAYHYDALTVQLCVNEVLDYRGTPTGREGQALEWITPDALQHIDLLEANTAITRAVVLPRLCLITDTARFGVQRTLDLLAKHVAAQRVLLIVREKTLDRSRLASFVDKARAICRPRGSMVCLHADAAGDAGLQADGIHLPARALASDMPANSAGLAGFSCHNNGEIRAAWARGADYVLLSPVRRTASHPEAEPLGWQRFAALCDDSPMPVYALGGMTIEDQDTAIEHGAQGVAMLGGAWGDSS